MEPCENKISDLKHRDESLNLLPKPLNCDHFSTYFVYFCLLVVSFSSSSVSPHFNAVVKLMSHLQ